MSWRPATIEEAQVIVRAIADARRALAKQARADGDPAKERFGRKVSKAAHEEIERAGIRIVDGVYCVEAA